MSSMALATLIYFVFILAFAAVVLVICREIVAWYFKINEVVTLLREIRDRLPEPRPAPMLQRPAQPRPASPSAGTSA